MLAIELALLVRRHPHVGVWLTASAALLSSFGWPPGIEVAGFRVYLLDLTALVLLGATGLSLRKSRPLSASVVVFLALLALAVIRGVAEFGIDKAVNASRGFLYFLAAVAFTQVCLKDPLPVIRRAWVVLAVVLVGVAAVFWLQHGLGTYAAGGDRALNSTQSLLIAHAGFLAVGTQHRWARSFAAVCLVVVLASQQRTVWAATVFAVALLAFRAAPHGMRRISTTARRGVFAGLLTVAVLLVLGPSELQESTTLAVTNVSTQSGTFGWRIQGWTTLLEDFFGRSFVQQMLGQPSGFGFDRLVGGRLATASPHNMYIAVLLSLGYAGLLAFAALMTHTVRSSRNGDPILFAIIGSILVFSIGYQLGPEHGLLVGSALTLAQSPSAARATHYLART